MSAPINRPNGGKAIASVDSDNHPDIEVVCGYIQSIIVARGAQSLLDSGNLPVSGSVVVLPVWTWMHSAISVGRKDRASDGGRLLMPVRLSWSHPSVLVVAENTVVHANYTLLGMGHSGAGATTVSSSMTGSSRHALMDGQLLPSVHSVRPMSERRMLHELNKLVEEGNIAQWEMTMWLDKWTQHIVSVAHAAICFDVFETPVEYKHLLDKTTLSAIADVIMFGAVDVPGEKDAKESAFARMLERCLSPNTFIKVDPLRYILCTLRENADRAVRARIGDPFIGPKIRKVARQHNLTDISEVVSVYRGLYPKDRLRQERAIRALSVLPDLMADAMTIGLASDDGDDEDNAKHYSDIYGNIVSK